MSLWSGFGLNYGALNPYNSATVETDFTYLRSLGVTNIRLSIPDYNASLTNTLDMAQRARTHGFTHIICGCSSNPTQITASNVSAFQAGIISFATTMSATGNIDEFQIGNEETTHVDGSTITSATIITDLLSWVASIRAVSGSMQLSYATNNGDIYSWITAGKGTLDKISANIYGFYNPTITGQRIYFEKYIKDWYSTFGSNGYVSEFNINPLTAWWTAPNMTDAQMEDEIRQRYVYLKASGIPNVYYYTYTTAGDDFAAKKQNGDFRTLFETLVGQRWWFNNVPNQTVTSLRSMASARPAAATRSAASARSMY